MTQLIRLHVALFQSSHRRMGSFFGLGVTMDLYGREVLTEGLAGEV